MSAYKKLNRQDSFISTYTARKSWTVGETGYSAYGIRNLYGEKDSTNTSDKLLYDSIKHLYYKYFKDVDTTEVTPSNFYDNYRQSSTKEEGRYLLENKVTVYSIPREVYGTHIEPGTVKIYGTNYMDTGYVDSGYLGTDTDILLDDKEGNLYVEGSSPIKYVGNVIYAHGHIIFTDTETAGYKQVINSAMEWKSNQPLYTHNYHCTLKASEFNHTLNNSALLDEYGEKTDNAKDENFQPYITTVGLYNDANELIAVAKTGQPIIKSADTDTTIIVKLDI